MKRSIGCPLCRKTMMEGETLHKYIEELDNLILNMPVEPEEIMNAYCNECNLQFDVKFHPFGLKCNKCGGYNTKL
jgi:RING finger/CHY zinc finger protein 1